MKTEEEIAAENQALQLKLAKATDDRRILYRMLSDLHSRHAEVTHQPGLENEVLRLDIEESPVDRQILRRILSDLYMSLGFAAENEALQLKLAEATDERRILHRLLSDLGERMDKKPRL